MKKYLLYTIFAIALISSCKKGINPAPGERPEERTSATLNNYNATLTGSANGWKALLFPQGGGVYLFSMKFNTNDRVSMLSDINNASSATSLESTYRLRQQTSPSLLFDTYSYIHLLTDPDPSANGGVAGSGYKSDFEFYFDGMSGDTLKLVGNKLGSKLLLVKASSVADYNNFTKGTQDVLGKLAQLRTYFKRVTIGGVDCEVKVDAINKQLIFTYIDGGKLKSVIGSFYVNGTSIVFLTPFTIGTTTVNEFKAVTFDVNTFTLAGTVNGVSFSVKEAITPLQYDVNAASRWYAQMPVNFNTCWVSDKAFHANGVDDFCNFRAVPNYTTLWYAAKNVFGGTNDGMITFTTGLAAPYTFSVTPPTFTNGIARFTLFGSTGTFTGTAPIALAMASARNIMYGGAVNGAYQDWYIIPTSADGTKYDMVRVSDAQAWISWRPR